MTLASDVLALDVSTVTTTSGGDLAEQLIDLIVGSKQVRIGPKPDAKTRAAMRAVIERYTGRSLPIPFMCPWGSEKPDGSTVDVAEVCALKMIACLDERVRTIYAPGIICHIRVEDVSAPHLFFDRADEARREAELYSDAFEELVRVLGYTACIRVCRESARVDEATFNRAADDVLPYMEAHLADLTSAEAFAQVKERGWQSPVTPEMADEYLERYARLYPDKTPEERRHILARYFSGVIARYKLGLRGDDPSWEGSFLDLSFVEPSRSSGHIFPRRVYYRTVPLRISSNHVPPWRAKGYLVPSHVGWTPRLSSFHHLPADIRSESAVLTGRGSEVEVRCDVCELRKAA